MKISKSFLEKIQHAMTVETWDGKERALISVDYIHRMHQEICLFGPLAGMYGREVQQLLMASEARIRLLWKILPIPLTWEEHHLRHRH